MDRDIGTKSPGIHSGETTRQRSQIRLELELFSIACELFYKIIRMKCVYYL